MNHILKKDITIEKNYKIISQQFSKIISFGRRSSSAERKSIRALKNSVHRKTSSNSKKIIFPVNIRLFDNNLRNLSKNKSTNAINIRRATEKLNDIKIIKENNITDINIIFKNRDKARTFNRQSNNNQIKISSGVNSMNQIKSNQITFNNAMKIQNEKHRNNREIYKKKLVIENPALSINDMNNKTTNIKNKILIRNNSGFNMSINMNNSSSKRNTDISQEKQKRSDIIINNNNNIKNTRKIKLKNKVKNKNKDLIINNNNCEFNYTMNTKVKNINDLKQKIFGSNSFQKMQINDNKNTDLNVLFKKRKNIDINTEYQTNPIIHIYSMDKNNMHINNKMNNNINEYINFNNTTTNKVKFKLFEINKEKENIRFTENNTILKTKSKAKVKIPDIKKDSSLGGKIKIDNNKNNNNIFSKVKDKNIQKNVKNDINRNNTYNNESSFFTININSSNIDENNNNENKNSIKNYCFVSSAHDKEKINNINPNIQLNGTINNKNAKKINKFNVFKTNSNTNKNKILQNSVFDFITDSHNFTSDNFMNNKNGNEISNKNTLNIKEEDNLKIIDKNNVNIKQNNNNKDKIEEIIENKNINILNNNEEIKEKDTTFLDKSASRVIQFLQKILLKKMMK